MPLPLLDPRIIAFELKRPTQKDEMLIPFSPICSAALSCNAAAHPILNSCQGQSFAFYTLKYMMKDAIALVNPLSCLAEAKKAMMEI